MFRLEKIPDYMWPSTNGSWQGHECHLYVIQEGKSFNLKVGVAVNPIWRASSLRSGNPRPLHLRAVYGGERADCLIAEGKVLEAFADMRLQGEWIREQPDRLVSYIENLIQEDSDG